MKEVKSVLIIFAGLSILFFLADIWINYRIYYQVNGLESEGIQLFLFKEMSGIVDIFIHLGGLIAGPRYALFFLKFFSLFLLLCYTSFGKLKYDEEKPTMRFYVMTVVITFLYLSLELVSPFQYVASNGEKKLFHILLYEIIKM